MDGAGASEPFRAYLPSLPGWVEPVIYLGFGLVLLVFLRDATLRLRRYGVGWRRFLGDLVRAVLRRPGAVVAVLAGDAIGQRRVRRQRYAGVMHVLILWSFLVLTAGTLLIALEEDVTARLGVRILRGNFYLGYEIAMDTAGLLLVIGVLMAIWRRYASPPEHLGRWRPGIPLVYALLLYAAVSGFFVEALRLLVQPVPWARYSYVGWALSRLLAPAVGDRPLALYWGLWGAHLAGAFAAMAFVLRTALDHALLLPLHMTLRAGHEPGLLEFPFNLATLTDETALEEVTAGFGSVEELDWWRRMSFDICVDCGRCDLVCPALAAGRPLSPRALVQTLGAEVRGSPDPPGEGGGDLFTRGVVDEATVWSCLTCWACSRECPAWTDVPGTIVDLRRNRVGHSRLDERQTSLLDSLERHGNPFGVPASERAEWLAGLGVPTVRERPDAQYLYWIGCMAAFDLRLRQVAESVIRILQHAGVSFAVLGEEERCCQESARKMGDEGGFQVQAVATIALLRELGVKRILTHCAHCFSTLARDYPALGGSFEVVHHTQLIAQLIRDGRVPAPTAPLDGPVTYHDPCNLGRLFGEYRAPREVAGFGAGGPLVEMERSGDRSFCCGAGGGNYFWVVPEGEKVSHLRLDQARATGATTLATACPFCLAMLADASSSTHDRMRVADVAELVARGLAGQDDPWARTEGGSGSVQPAAGSSPP